VTIDEKSERAEIVDRIRERLQRDGLDAYLAYTPQNNHYCSGFVSWFVGEHWRFHGGQLTLIPADPSLPLGMMLPEAEVALGRSKTDIADLRDYAMWIETRGLDVITRPPSDGSEAQQRPSWWDPDEQDGIVRGLLGDRGLLKGRIATDVEFAMSSSLERFRRLAPDADWIDWTAAILELRSIKQPFEVDRLRRGVELQEIAFEKVRTSLESGLTPGDLRIIYTRAVLDAAQGHERYDDFADSWILVSAGPAGANARLAKGDLVALDGGVRIGGYKTDGARTFAFGEPSAAARRLYETLLGANDRACTKLVPGVPVADVFEVAERHMRANGYPRYSRGQYGHSVGLEQFPEEPPYISRGEKRPVEAGMVFAVETPYYGADLGVLTIEDMWLVTDDGPEPMHSAPRELRVER